ETGCIAASSSWCPCSNTDARHTETTSNSDDTDATQHVWPYPGANSFGRGHRRRQPLLLVLDEVLRPELRSEEVRHQHVQHSRFERPFDPREYTLALVDVRLVIREGAFGFFRAAHDHSILPWKQITRSTEQIVPRWLRGQHR